MQSIKVAAVSLNQTPLDWEHNRSNILKAIENAKKENISVLCCPELCVTGYGCEDMFLSTTVVERALKEVAELANETHNMAVAVGLPILHLGHLYNAVCLMANGRIVGFVAKQHLAGDGVYYEHRWFKPWSSGLIAHVTVDDVNYPLGDLIFNLSGIRLGFEICEDAWVVLRTGISLAKRGIDLILNPSASHFSFGKWEIRRRFVEEGAKNFQVGYIYANLLGNEAGRMIYDGDTLIAAGDDWLADGHRFSFKDQIMSSALINVQHLRQARSKYGEFPKDFTGNDPAEKGIISIDFKFSEMIYEASEVNNLYSFHKKHQSKEEEFGLAVALGLFDYLRKSRAFGFVINLSGGADSATSVCLIYLMVHLAFKELGESEFQKKLPHIFKMEDKLDAEKIFKTLLCCLYQKSENSSDTTWQAALSLSQFLGFPLFQFSVDTMVKQYRDVIQSIIGRTLNWTEDDLALQNIQARVRGPSAWLLANVKQFLLLATSNRSEAAVGYATMDGDTCGGLSPIAGVDKSYILHWLQWLEKNGFEGIGPMTVLQAINVQKPTAELRPPSKIQTDEDDLMPYAWLDTIEHLFVRDKHSPLEILKIMQQQYPHQTLQTLANCVERFFIAWAQSQWKRERLAPSFHLEDASVDPKTWCRFPILSGGFKEELKEMWYYANSTV